MLDVGQLAPDFELPSSHNTPIKLSDYKSKWVILYFYPKDNTSGCTAEACDFRDNQSEFSNKNVVIVGVSRDSVKSHLSFQEKYSLPFPLLSDQDGEVCQKYGVWVEKSMYGRKYFGIERSTFLIDPAGKVAKIWRKVKVPAHVREVLKELSR